MLIHLLVLIAFSYGIFILISSYTNPFITVKRSLKKRKFLLGRAVAVAAIVAGSIAIVMLHVFSMPPRTTLTTFLIMFGLFMVPSVIKYRQSSVWG